MLSRKTSRIQAKVLHAIEVNAEQIIFVSIDFNGETRFDMQVLWITSILLKRFMLVIRGSTVFSLTFSRYVYFQFFYLFITWSL